MSPRLPRAGSIALLLLALSARFLAAQQPASPAPAIPRVRLATATTELEGDVVASTPDSLLLQLSRGVGDDRVDTQRWVPLRCVRRAQVVTSQGDRRGTVGTRTSWLVPIGAVIGGTIGFVLTSGTERPHVYEATTPGPYMRNMSVGLGLGAAAGLVAGVWSGWRHPAPAWAAAPAFARFSESAESSTHAPSCDAGIWGLRP